MQKNESKNLSKIAVIGIDAGGTKTEGVLASIDGKVLFKYRLGCANYQAIGIEDSKKVLSSIVKKCERKAKEFGLSIKASGYGISGLDRIKDAEAIENMIKAIDPVRPKVIANDTFLILRAGTIDGVGVAVVSGTGPNTVGRNSKGNEFRIGGLCYELGDFGGGLDIAREAVRRARRGKDGRGKPTTLGKKIITKFKLKEIEDIMDAFIFSEDLISMNLGEITPIVFECASEGDEVAREILNEAGTELGLCARLVARKLFKKKDKINIVLGGSVLQKGENPIMRESLIREFKTEFSNVDIIKLDSPPVLGGILFAIDKMKENGLLPDGYKWPDIEVLKKFKINLL